VKILVISLAGIGDTLFATPLIHELRANFPDATIEALVRWPGARDLLANNPHLNRVHQKDLMKCGIWTACGGSDMTFPSIRTRKAGFITGWWRASLARGRGSAMSTNVPARRTAGW
jgi:hypothetical protein